MTSIGRETVKKFVGSFVALIAMVAAMLLGSTAAANATGADDAECTQDAISLVVICDVDFNITILEDPDVVIEVVKNEIVSGNDIEVLENALKNADILNGTEIEVNLIKAVVADVLDVDVDDVTVYLCSIISSHPHCH